VLTSPDALATMRSRSIGCTALRFPA
jgi:hypothetical protein